MEPAPACRKENSSQPPPSDCVLRNTLSAATPGPRNANTGDPREQLEHTHTPILPIAHADLNPCPRNTERNPRRTLQLRQTAFAGTAPPNRWASEHLPR